jgi:hypothetical protein
MGCSQAATAQLRHARAEETLSHALDAAADRAAVAAGSEMPPERAQHAAREARQLAARRDEAARSHALGTQLELARTIDKHRVVWVADQGGAVSAAECECLDLLERLGVAYEALAKERVLLSGLEGFPLGGAFELHAHGQDQSARHEPGTGVRDDQGADLTNIEHACPKLSTHVEADTRPVTGNSDPQADGRNDSTFGP